MSTTDSLMLPGNLRRCMPWIVSVVLFLLLAPGTLDAQQRLGIGEFSEERVNLEVRPAKQAVEAGSTIRIAYLLNLEEGWGVNTNEPSIPFLTGTSLSVDDRNITGARLVEVNYPPAHTREFDYASQPLTLYEGQAPIVATFEIFEDTEPGWYELETLIQIQACSEELCLSPSMLREVVPIEVVPAGTDIQAQHEEFFASIEQGGLLSGHKVTILWAGAVGVLIGLIVVFRKWGRES